MLIMYQDANFENLNAKEQLSRITYLVRPII
jgi:hypothetical protein